jgi:hypothetical protein
MADPKNEGHTPERYEETTDPRNPPYSVVNPNVRRNAFRSFVGPLLVFFIIAGFALIYWANRGPVVGTDQNQVGTTGDTIDAAGERSNDTTPGGIDPAPRPDSTRDELRYRGADSEPQGPMPALKSGGDVELRNMTVVESRDNMFWIQNGSKRVAVMAPKHGPAVQTGARVDVTGVGESDGQGGLRIRAERVDVR